MTRRRSLLAAALATSLLCACSDDDGAAGGDRTSGPLRSSSVAPPGGERRITVDGRPSAVAVTALGVWAADDGPPSAAGRVWRFVDGSRAPGEATALSAPPVALVPDGDGVWAVGASGAVARVLPWAEQEPVVAERPVDGAEALVDGVVHDGRLYVGDIGRSVVHVLDAASGAVLAAPIAVPAGVVRLAVDGARLWVSGLEHEVTPVDLASHAAGASVPVGEGPIGIAVVDGVVWVANSDDDTVSRVDAATGAPVGPPVPVGDAPIVVRPDGAGALWVLNQDDATLLRLDLRTGARVDDPVELPMRPRGMAVDADGVWVVGVDPPLVLHVARP